VAEFVTLELRVAVWVDETVCDCVGSGTRLTPRYEFWLAAVINVCVASNNTIRRGVGEVGGELNTGWVGRGKNHRLNISSSKRYNGVNKKHAPVLRTEFPLACEKQRLRYRCLRQNRVCIAQFRTALQYRYIQMHSMLETPLTPGHIVKSLRPKETARHLALTNRHSRISRASKQETAEGRGKGAQGPGSSAWREKRAKYLGRILKHKRRSQCISAIKGVRRGV
jgi:hypothetical protein